MWPKFLSLRCMHLHSFLYHHTHASPQHRTQLVFATRNFISCWFCSEINQFSSSWIILTMAAVSQALLQHPAAFNTQKQTTGLSAARLNSILVPATKISAKKSSSKQHRIFAQQLDSHSLQPQSRPGDSCACLAATITAPELVEEKVDYNEMAKQLIHASPLEIMDKALSMFGNDIAIAFSGAEDVALIEYARLTGRPFRVFSLDTGRLNPETYQLFAEVEKRYNIHIEYMFPEAVEVQALVRSKGLFSFYEDGHQECCSIRKVKPLKRALRGLRAWITGQRRDQSPGTRATVPIAQVDPSFEGLEGGVGSLVKWNPLANVTGDVVWKFLRTMEVPVNALHHKGYVSIGCEPCTRPVLPGQHEREGRWWWEDSKAKECGLHKGNIEVTEGNNKNSVHAANGAGDLFTNENVLRLTREGVERLASLEERKEAWLVVLYAPWCQFCQGMESSYDEVAYKLKSYGVKVAKFRADGEHKSFCQERLQLETFPTILLFPKHSSKAIKYPSEKRDVDSLLAFVKTLQ